MPSNKAKEESNKLVCQVCPPPSPTGCVAAGAAGAASGEPHLSRTGGQPRPVSRRPLQQPHTDTVRDTSFVQCCPQEKVRFF